jgi:hypothetical protein
MEHSATSSRYGEAANEVDQPRIIAGAVENHRRRTATDVRIETRRLAGPVGLDEVRDTLPDHEPPTVHPGHRLLNVLVPASDASASS